MNSQSQIDFGNVFGNSAHQKYYKFVLNSHILGRERDLKLTHTFL